MSVTADTSEVDALAADLTASAVKAQAASHVAVQASAQQLRDWAAAEAPVRTGELRASIYVRDGVVGSDVRQGFYQEFGTSVMPPQPWLYVNSDRTQTRLAELLERSADPV